MGRERRSVHTCTEGGYGVELGAKLNRSALMRLEAGCPRSRSCLKASNDPCRSVETVPGQIRTGAPGVEVTQVIGEGRIAAVTQADEISGFGGGERGDQSRRPEWFCIETALCLGCEKSIGLRRGQRESGKADVLCWDDLSGPNMMLKRV